MEYFRKTKIICTIGPSSEDEETMKNLMLAGMNVARFNFSHGDHAEQKEKLNRLKKVREELQLPVAALMDTKGPEIRLKDFKDGKVTLDAGQTFTLTTKDVEGTKEIVSITYKDLPKDVEVGTHILIDDGLIEMEVTEVTDTDIICRVDNGGALSNKKGVNVPNVDLSMDYISPKDYKDIVFAVQQDFDFIAASFVRSAEDVRAIRDILLDHGRHDIQIIAKIENMQGFNNIDEIIAAADGIMVARGDLGVEVPMEDVPIMQKMIIKKTYEAGKIVVTATQMLDSMIHNPRPTRAEVTDVANAVYDGTSAIMLSGETAAGAYPIEAVKTMAKIAVKTEKNIDYIERLRRRSKLTHSKITDAITHSTCTMASDLDATAIVTLTKSGKTAHSVSRFRPEAPIIAGVMTEKVMRQMNLAWGIIPIMVEEKTDAEELIVHAIECGKEKGLLEEGDIVVVTAGVPLGISGTTNLIR
ncbi:MAG: pyruvate kinase, partial [Lachnospiraceae bacterium]|nr:pyruvate kinase [Lachnospiraceae bacterium]